MLPGSGRSVGLILQRLATRLLFVCSQDLQVRAVADLPGFGIKRFHPHLLEHPLTADLLRGDDLEAAKQLALSVVALDAKERAALLVYPKASDAIL